jgi:hypothetical protein
MSKPYIVIGANDSHSKLQKCKIEQQIWGGRGVLQDLLIPQCNENSIQISNIDANTNPSNQYEMRRDDLKKFATQSPANDQINYWLQLTLTQCCQTEM